MSRLKILRRQVLGSRRIQVRTTKEMVDAAVSARVGEQIEAWNKEYPPGTRVAYRANELADQHVGKTSTAAFVSDGRAVVWIYLCFGEVPLDLVIPLTIVRPAEVRS